MHEATLQSSSEPRRILITAGPTHEDIDQVRYLANRSSGRMGVAIAQAAVNRGWIPTLLLGPVPQTPAFSTAAKVLRFRSTCDLQSLMAQQWPKHDVLIMAAAVADYRLAGGTLEGKLPRKDGRFILELESTPDLLAEAAANARPDQTLIGFALAHKKNLSTSAKRKLKSKSVHAIIANPLETMNAADISATVYLADGQRRTPPDQLSKAAFANWLLDLIPEIESIELDTN